MTWIMLIVSLETGRVRATIPYQTRSDCESEIPLAYKGNWPGTVHISCRPVLEGEGVA